MAKGSWDELMKLINKYLRKNKDKEGVLKLLTRKEIGDIPAIGVRFRNPLNETQYSLANKGMTRDRQYYLFKTYEKDIFDDIMKILRKMDDQGIKLGREQLKNLEYNVGILKMLRNSNIKSADVLRKDGKNPSEVMKKQEKENFVGDVGIMGSLENQLKKLKALADEMKPENIAKKEADEKAIRDKQFKKLYHGRAYEGRSDQYRGLSYQLAKLHEAGIIKLDDEIYKSLKEGKYHWAGADMFAPDPPRIWRYHFGDEIFDKFDEVLGKFDDDTFIGPNAMENWMKKEGIKPIKVDGPKNALDYMDEVELIAHAEEAQNSINIFKSDDHFYSNLDMSPKDKAENVMRAIVDNAEKKKKYLDTLKKNYPEAYEKMDWKTVVDESHPSYKKDEIPNIQDALKETDYQVISEGDEGWDEISKKLGIKARPGDNLELESNVIEGPWTKSTKASKLDESKYATDKEFKSDLRSTMLNVVENNPDFNLQIIERLKKEGDRIYSPYGEGKLLSADQRQKVLKEIKKVMTDADYQQQWGIEAGTYTDDMFKIDIEEVGKTSKPVVKETVSETIDISKLSDKDLNKLVDELHMNQGKMAEVDSTGGSRMGYEEFKQLEKRNDEIQRALDRAKKMYEDLGEGTGNFQYDYATWMQKFGAKQKPGSYSVFDQVLYIKSLKPIDAMKEANKVLEGTGRYKGLSKADQDKIIKDTHDHIFERDKPMHSDDIDPDDFDPEKFAKGGRVGLSEGTQPYNAETFKEKSDLYLQGILGTSNKDFYKSKLQNEYEKAMRKGALSAKEAMEWVQDRAKLYSTLIDESKRQERTLGQELRGVPSFSLPTAYGVEKDKKSQGGRVGYSQGSTSGNLDDLLQRLRMVVEGLGIYSDYNQTQRKQMQKSLTSQINVLLQN